MKFTPQKGEIVRVMDHGRPGLVEIVAVMDRHQSSFRYLDTGEKGTLYNAFLGRDHETVRATARLRAERAAKIGRK